MDWEASVDGELAALNAAHSGRRIDTPEYRLRRRMLLRSLARRRGGATHTLRRPAGAVVTVLPVRPVVPARERRWTSWAWWVGAILLAAAASLRVYL
ncbi:hypothetical protein [Luteibacter sp. 329MFSha]|uniref:hypothetical protein n=1 Tax=Luteibacter sp. 329MFSha TaxID=1798239 RepID=UPI0008B80410|nr:hypothetical protein [Luteibacter sp. 329MFSha]SEW01533.1 hypothetical protein SAMN04515660_1797 [Luteibacter sp. 329MFSha]